MNTVDMCVGLLALQTLPMGMCLVCIGTAVAKVVYGGAING